MLLLQEEGCSEESCWDQYQSLEPCTNETEERKTTNNCNLFDAIRGEHKKSEKEIVCLILQTWSSYYQVGKDDSSADKASFLSSWLYCLWGILTTLVSVQMGEKSMTEIGGRGDVEH